MIKYSRQRECILNNLRGRYDHPTADMVYAGVKDELPNISLGTVYRNLSLLADMGEILKLTTGIGPDRFDGHTQPHNHFVCRVCGQVSDLDYIPRERICERAGEHFDGVIESYNIQFFGTCKHCLSQKTNTIS